MKQKNRVSKSLLLPNPAIIHEAPPHSNQAIPSRIMANGAFLSPACVPSTNTQYQAYPPELSTPFSGYKSEAPRL